MTNTIKKVNLVAMSTLGRVSLSELAGMGSDAIMGEISSTLVRVGIAETAEVSARVSAIATEVSTLLTSLASIKEGGEV